MKKTSIIFVNLLLTLTLLHAQNYSSVSVEDSVYKILENAQIRGLCQNLSQNKPYTEFEVKNAITEILENAKDNSSSLNDNEIQILTSELEKYNRKTGLDLKRGGYFLSSNNKGLSATMDITASLDMNASASLYNGDDFTYGGNFMPTISALGDVGSRISYSFSLFGVIARAPLTQVGTYKIGEFWYDENSSDKIIKTFTNNAFFPFSYQKKWDGSVYKPGGLDASGLEGWCDNLALGFGIHSEVTAGFLNDNLILRVGRIKREWAAMENGSSLVLNSNASPFLAGEGSLNLFNWLKLSTLTGVLEFPNSDYMTGDAFDSEKTFQNAFSSTMVEADFKYLHADFGSNCVWPKRFELGYIYPLMNKVFYQNNIGDFDNLSLFANVKVKYPKIGYMWCSLFLDEVNGFNKTNGILSGKLFEYDRDMFALQAGVKAYLPFWSFSNISVRYTKIEPYCYTHHQINYTPWYNGTYISEAYQSGGVCLGYYLPPNSDELNVMFETMPLANLITHVQYQFIRHGADYGSSAVDGSSLYSELNPNGRNDDPELRKYFLRDGAYQWFHIIKLGASLSIKGLKIPVTIYGEAGYVYSYFTNIDGEANSGTPSDYKKIDTEEYPVQQGAIVSLGVKILM